MPEYQGLVYTIGRPFFPTYTPKQGKVASAKTSAFNWTSSWLFDKSTEHEISIRLKTLRPEIEHRLDKGFGVLVVCQYRHFGIHKRLHAVFIGAAAETKTLAISQKNAQHGKPVIRPDPPHGWHIGDETFLWFDAKQPPKFESAK